MRDRPHDHTSVARVRTTRPSCTPPPTPPPPESQSVYFAIKCALFVSSRRVADVPDDTCRPITHFPRAVACMVACSSPTATPLLPGRRHELSNSGRWHRARTGTDSSRRWPVLATGGLCQCDASRQLPLPSSRSCPLRRRRMVQLLGATKALYSDAWSLRGARAGRVGVRSV